jgi:hypothetical protein
MGSETHVCACCRKEIPPARTLCCDRVITGGVCEECLDRIGAQPGMPLRDFLDGIQAPVLLVDSGVVVKTANLAVQSLLKKDISQMRGERGGDVFECEYASQPGGCGGTLHCSGCAIRRAVTETFLTGESRSNVPAFLNERYESQFRQLGLQISTEKVWGMVLLRIDYIGPAQEASPAPLVH